VLPDQPPRDREHQQQQEWVDFHIVIRSRCPRLTSQRGALESEKDPVSATYRVTGALAGARERNVQTSSMPKIIDFKPFDGFERKIERLGLTKMLDEVRQLISDFVFLLAEAPHGNSAAALRVMLDERFSTVSGWRIVKSGGIDWTKCLRYDGAEVCMGVELQISARSDLLTNDLAHLVQAIEVGNIDVGVIVVPSNETARYLTDRCPRFSYAEEHVNRIKGQF